MLKDLNLFPQEKVRAKLLDGVTLDASTCCWTWTRTKNQRGYGRMCMHINNRTFTFATHRVSYVLHRGEIVDDGLVIDHLCRNRACCNPDHLELVDPYTNMMRGNRRSSQTHCKRGHELSGDNIRIDYPHIRKDGALMMRRKCKECERIGAKRRAEAT